jgi:uncharacterized protein (DUF885 family)
MTIPLAPLLAVVLVLCAPCLVAAARPAGEPAGRSPELIALLDEHVDWLMREHPLWASERGDLRFNDRLGDVSAAAVARRQTEMQDRLERLKALDRSRFTPDDVLDARLLEYELTLAIEGARFHPEQTPIDQRSGPQIWLPQMGDRLPFLQPSHQADYATRLEQVAAQIDQQIANMRAGIEAGRLPPRVTVIGTDAQAAALAEDSVRADPTLSPFFSPLRLPDADPQAVARAREAISTSIVPAYRRLAEFLQREYIPVCRDTVGISQGVDGLAAYEYALRSYTTTNLTADQIHLIGLDEVARIRAEMFQVIARTDFPRKDELSGEALLAEFIEYLRTDPRFYYDDSEALLTAYRDICKRIDPELPSLFSRLPRLPYGVRPTPAFAAPTAPTAYYYGGSLKTGVPGYFIANTYRLDQRPNYEMIALTLHEAVPGHHLQIALADELEDVHEFRRLLGYTGFVEGWALYAERLGLEMGDNPEHGLYADPYDDFGRLTYEMWRACRLVVDTGIHAKGWTRRQAVDYMLENTALSEYNIEREVDRYISWPGQACAYKLGELTIRRLRARAEKTLKDRFDLRAFHDTVLGAGAIPLPVLEERVDAWIAAQAATAE